MSILKSCFSSCLSKKEIEFIEKYKKRKTKLVLDLDLIKFIQSNKRKNSKKELTLIDNEKEDQTENYETNKVPNTIITSPESKLNETTKNFI